MGFSYAPSFNNMVDLQDDILKMATIQKNILFLESTDIGLRNISNTWEQHIYDNECSRKEFIREYYPKKLNSYISYTNANKNSDIFKYIWVYHNGGVYSKNMLFLESLSIDELFYQEANIFISSESNNVNFMASKINNVIWLKMFDMYLEGEMLNSFYTERENLESMLEKNRSNYTVIPLLFNKDKTIKEKINIVTNRYYMILIFVLLFIIIILLIISFRKSININYLMVKIKKLIKKNHTRV
jgi:hypothetical protein